MNAVELRLNNWVNYISIKGEELYHIVDIPTLRNIDDGKFKIFEPISLTEEILLKVDGLIKPTQYFEGYTMFSIKVEVGYLTISKKDNDDFYVLNTGYVEVKIKYLHQLQNLYFALTGEELIINNLNKKN